MARLERRDRQVGVRVGGCQDEHGVDVIARHEALDGRLRRCACEPRDGGRGPLRFEVRDRGDAHGVRLEQRRQVAALEDVARADDADPQRHAM